jgi:hypothetical protein
LPMEFAAEADKLLSLKLEGTVGWQLFSCRGSAPVPAPLNQSKIQNEQHHLISS